MKVVWALLLSSSASAAPLHLWHAYRGGEEEALQQACERFTRQTGIEVVPSAVVLLVGAHRERP